jgi:hypothetical protein
MSARATSSFRRLLRAARIAFKDDMKAVKLAKIQLKQEFLQNKNISDINTLNELFRGVDEAEELLSFQIVQGTKNNRGNYGNYMIYML